MIDYDLYCYLIWALSGVLLIFLFLTSGYYFSFWGLSKKEILVAPHSEKKTKFAILIAARNESNVIVNIFNSLKEQTYDPKYFDVWVIVESEDDPTCKIATEYGYHYFVRDRLEDGRRTKGFALQECIDYFWRENLEYDAYMIFDADNVMDKNYIEVMNDLRQTGVQVGLGDRKFTNANENWLTVCSAIMFTYMNQITSRGRTLLFHKATLMGTGYFIDSSIIKDIGGWIFTGMTEDIQLTTFCYYHDIYMRFYPLVSFYDEQSPDYKTVHGQHLRWLFGYFERRKYLKVIGTHHYYHTKGMESFMRVEFNGGLFPFVIFHVLTFITMVLDIIFAILAAAHQQDPSIITLIVLNAIYSGFILYLTFVIPACLVMKRHGKSMQISKSKMVLGVFTYIFFFYDFALAAIDGFFHPSKRHTWKQTAHSGTISNDDAKKVS